MTAPGPPTVAVTGTAQRDVAPDSFAFAARIEVRAGSSTEAHQLLAARAAELDDAMAALPVDAVRGQVSGWQEGRRAAVWVAVHSVEVTGRDLESAADVAGALGAVGDVSVQGPMWRIDDDNPAHDDLQAAAVHEARARAQRYAEALGGSLGRLVELSDQQGRGGAHPLAGRAASPAGVAPGLETLDVEPQPVRLSASVNARWYLDLSD